MTIKLVVFDFDGTLTPEHVDGNRLIAQYLGKEDEFKKIVTDYNKRKISFKIAVESLCQLAKGLTLREIMKIRSQLILRDGVLDTFYQLRKKGVKIAIVTGEPNEMMRGMLKILKPDFYDGTDTVFDSNGIFTGRVDWDFKYKSGLVHHLINKYSLRPFEVLGVGDSWGDKMMVPDGGYFVTIGDQNLKDLEDFHINEIPDILAIIDKLAKK